MAKSRYVAGEKVKVIKAGIFQELEGEVISMGKSDLPVKVNLGLCGTWNFKTKELETINKQKK